MTVVGARSRRAVLPSLPVVFGLSEIEAATSIGVSATTFRQMVVDKIMPSPRMIGARKVWDVDELREAFKAMPHQGEVAAGDTWADILSNP